MPELINYKIGYWEGPFAATCSKVWYGKLGLVANSIN